MHQPTRLFSLHCCLDSLKTSFFSYLNPKLADKLIYFLNHLVVSVMKRWRANLSYCTRSQISCLYPIGAGLQKLFCFSTRQTKVQILGYGQITRRVNISGVLERTLNCSSTNPSGGIIHCLYLSGDHVVLIRYISMTLHVKLCACKVSVDRNFNFCLNVEVHDYLKADAVTTFWFF